MAGYGMGTYGLGAYGVGGYADDLTDIAYTADSATQTANLLVAGADGATVADAGAQFLVSAIQVTATEAITASDSPIPVGGWGVIPG